MTRSYSPAKGGPGVRPSLPQRASVMRAAVRLPCFELMVTVPRSGAVGVAIGGCWGEDREAEGGLEFAEDRAPGDPPVTM